MSSARSNAAARSRRAGGAEFTPPQQMNGRPGQPGQSGQPIMNPKLSISDAIALITLRLGRVEQIVQNIPVDNQQNISTENNENIRIVDDSVFESIVQRLDNVEKTQRFLNERKPEVIVAPPPPAPINIPKFEVPQHITSSIDEIKVEISQLKDLLLNLQSFTMKTNERLSNIVFTESQYIENEECGDNIILSSNVDVDISNEVNTDVETPLDLKTLVESELLSS